MSTIHELPWWKKTTVYQIYPRSFKDSTSNGIGDIPGIISKLDYLKELGIETIWFSPFFSSPQGDHGYDVSDYRDIAPEYGTLSDCDRLVHEIHDREMYAVFDMVLNHTSDQHPWFLESRSSRDNPKRDWYIWRDGRKPGGKKPPNNWNSMIGGSGWHYDEITDQWYWAQFLPFQPDLNYRNPDVKEEMFDIVRFWLDRGVDGFRLDIINTIYEDPGFRNNPFALKYIPTDDAKGFFHDNKYTINHPDNITLMKELRAVTDEYSDPERFLVGEVTASLNVLKQYCGDKKNNQRTDGLHLLFQFQSLSAELIAQSFRSLIQSYEEYFPEPYAPTWVFSNHDQRRRISRLGDSVVKAKLNAIFQLTVRGVPFIYYGEEIGMLRHPIPIRSAQDPVAQRYSWLPQTLASFMEWVSGISLNRDECRTPMQWSPGSNAGFSETESVPWLPVGPNHESINVEAEENNSDSLLNCYKELLGLRRNTPALHSGSIEIVDMAKQPRSLLVYERAHDTQSVQIWLNFSNRSLHISMDEPLQELLFSTTKNSIPLNESCVYLEPYQGIVAKIS